jgi:hypothetical protein
LVEPAQVNDILRRLGGKPETHCGGMGVLPQLTGNKPSQKNLSFNVFENLANLEKHEKTHSSKSAQNATISIQD